MGRTPTKKKFHRTEKKFWRQKIFFALFLNIFGKKKSTKNQTIFPISMGECEKAADIKIESNMIGISRVREFWTHYVERMHIYLNNMEENVLKERVYSVKDRDFINEFQSKLESLEKQLSFIRSSFPQS